MGGIAGIIHFQGDPPPRDQAQQLSSGVAHRGPDDKGLFVEGPAALVHRRFLFRSAEPREPVVGSRLVVMVDGRLYEGDSGTVAEAWARRGPASLGGLDGAFAIAVWDRREQELWLARDAIGRRPLFHAESAGRFAFCSEIPPLLHLPWVSRDPDTNHLAEYLSFRYVHAPRTLFTAISAIPPGHLLRLSATKQKLERWWQPRWVAAGASLPDPREATQKVDQAVRRSVQRRCQGDLPPVILLSGGLDSSAILHHAREQLSATTSFTVALSGTPGDESAFARRVGKVMETDHHVVRITSLSVLDALDTCTRAMGQPLPSAAGVLQYLLFAAIRPSARVVLSGDGGDEVLGGRGMELIAARMRRSRVADRLLGPLRPRLRGPLHKAGYRDIAASHADFGRMRGIGGSRVFRSAERVALLRDPGMARPGIRRTALEALYQEIDSDPINDILHVWLRGWLPEDSLARSDRMAAAVGLEVRYPMLDRALIELCIGLPGPAKVATKGTGFTTKAPLRRAMKGRVPPQLLQRPKRSLPGPLSQWLRTEGSDFLAEQVDTICDDPVALFVPAEVRKLAAQHQSGTHDHGLKLWSLCLFQSWRRVFQA